ncbi:MAG: hypothetical protein ACQESF_06085 [Nanobdellota archaeon]
MTKKVIRKLLGPFAKKTVSINYFKKYKKAMTEHLKRKEIKIKKLESEKEVWRKSAIKQAKRNYELEKNQ